VHHRRGVERISESPWEIRGDGARLSTVDLLGLGPVLVAGPASTGWPAAAAEVAHRLGVQVRYHHIGPDLADVTGRFLDAYGIDGDGQAWATRS